MMKKFTYKGIELFNLNDLFTDEAVERITSDVNKENERFCNRCVRSLKKSELTNKHTVTDIAFTIYPLLKINDKKNK